VFKLEVERTTTTPTQGRATSRWENQWVCWVWAIRGSFRRGFGWPPLYRQSMQQTSSLNGFAYWLLAATLSKRTSLLPSLFSKVQKLSSERFVLLEDDE
jgi:hypothetical protein